MGSGVFLGQVPLPKAGALTAVSSQEGVRKGELQSVKKMLPLQNSSEENVFCLT